MELGVVFPQSEIGKDPAAIRDFAQAAEAMGFTHLLIYDHVLGADRDRPGGYRGVYDKDTPFHEPLVTLGYLAGQTKTIEFCTTVLILPQRQAALVAKQAAEVDLLSGGRLDFGIGKGYRHNEFVGFRIPMEEAEPRFDESIDIITKAWTANERFSFHGKYWQYDDIIVEPPTIQKPHPPFWQGAGHADSIRRVARRGHNLLLDQLASLDETGRRFWLFRAGLYRDLVPGCPAPTWFLHGTFA